MDKSEKMDDQGEESDRKTYDLPFKEDYRHESYRRRPNTRLYSEMESVSTIESVEMRPPRSRDYMSSIGHQRSSTSISGRPVWNPPALPPAFRGGSSICSEAETDDTLSTKPVVRQSSSYFSEPPPKRNVAGVRSMAEKNKHKEHFVDSGRTFSYNESESGLESARGPSVLLKPLKILGGQGPVVRRSPPRRNYVGQTDTGFNAMSKLLDDKAAAQNEMERMGGCVKLLPILSARYGAETDFQKKAYEFLKSLSSAKVKYLTRIGQSIDYDQLDSAWKFQSSVYDWAKFND